VLKIGDFAKLARVSVKTLRHYGRLGVLKPAWVDRFTGYRYYTLDQLSRLNRILALKDLGFSLEEVRRLLRDDLSAAELRGMLTIKCAELERRVRTEQVRLQRVEARLQQMEREGEVRPYDVVLKALPARQVVGVRGPISTYRHIRQLFDELEQCIQRRDLTTGEDVPRIAIYYDEGGSEQGIDAEAAVPIAARLHVEPPAVMHNLPAVEAVACVVHHGAYDALGEAYGAAMAWIEDNGYCISGPTREVYLREPRPWPGPSPCVIDVQFPVERKTVSSFTIRAEEEGGMEPKIVTKPAFTVVGMEYRGKNDNNQIAQMWQEFIPRMREIKHGNYSWGTYGVCRDLPEGEGMHYLAAVEVDQVEDLPAGMVVWEVPEQTYAVFPCTLPTLHEAYRHAFETWLPGSGYRRADGPDFELYTEEFDARVADSRMYIYVPIH
jgi:predicted transcriptional regulator YdeE